MPAAAAVKTAHANPTWARDELILALDLYFKHPPMHISKGHPAVIELSEVLNRLPLHGDVGAFTKFRNPNGVYMKLCNFLRFDPSYRGKGLAKGAHVEKTIWDEFAGDRERLRRTAEAIRAGLKLPDAKSPETSREDDEEEFPEGKVLYRLHRARERSRTLRDRARAAAIKAGRGLACQACGFVFKDKYGDLGADYIECHHTRPVSELRTGAATKLRDVALLCSNCHRMVHRRRPWLGLEQLRTLLAG